MANPFANLKTEGVEKSEDRLGGGYSAKETGIYTGNIKQFYAGESSGGARSITVIVAGGDFGDQEYRETVYVTSGRDKGQKSYYMAKDKDGKETGKKRYLPGFEVANDIALCAGGVELFDLEFEEKVVKIYDVDEKKELPKSVPVATGLIGKQISLAIVKTKENQTEKDGQGNYVAKADGSTRDVNHIEKVFNSEHKLTVNEATAGTTQPTFWPAWEEKNKGVTRDKTSSQQGAGNAGRPPQSGGAGASGGNAAPRTSLFGNKS